MVDLIKEVSVWERLAGEKKPVVIYGMGDGAEKILRAFKIYGIKTADIFASDEFVRGHSFAGHKVLSYSQVCEKYNDFIVVLAFAFRDGKMISKIKKINETHEVLAPDVPVVYSNNYELFDTEFVRKHDISFKKAYALLEDEDSKIVFSNIINAKISGKIEYILDSFSPKSDVYTNILKISDKEYYLDLGAYDGDTIREFIFHSNGFSEITAVEPDVKNFKKLCDFVNSNFLGNVKCFNFCVSDKIGETVFDSKSGRNSRISENESGRIVLTDCVDNFMRNGNISFIKMDIEGNEMEALKGSEYIIKHQLPKLYISAYHRNEDLFSIPIKIAEMSGKYKIYLRHHDYIPSWETNYYGVPEI